jgi:hypothetical protein
MLAMALGLLMSNICYAQSAKESVRALQKLQARIEVGISYRDYAPALGDAKFEVNLFLQNPEAQEKKELALRIKKIMMIYEIALSAWGSSFVELQRGLVRPGMIRIVTVQPFTTDFPELEEEISAWNKITRQKDRLVLIEYVLRGIWRAAGRELQKTNDLLLGNLEQPKIERQEEKISPPPSIVEKKTGQRFIGEFPPPGLDKRCFWELDKTDWVDGKRPPPHLLIWEVKCRD